MSYDAMISRADVAARNRQGMVRGMKTSSKPAKRIPQQVVKVRSAMRRRK